ncbi:MAG: imelysin family protein [Nannocystaceae bacterium]|nr:imelysin family protein [Nannocystaceae bacterium]
MRGVSLLVLCCLGAACQTESGGSANGTSREALLESLAATVFTPTYAEFETASAALAVASAEVCAAPGMTSLTAAREAWRTTRAPLKRAEAWSFGPIASLGVDSAVDFWPVRTDAVEAAITSGEEPTQAWVTAQGTAAKGLPVIEYLLFAPLGEDSAIVASLDPQTPQGEHRCAVVAALGERVAARAAELHLAWRPDGGDYSGRLSADGDDTPDNPSLRMAVSDVVNGMIFVLQDITDGKLGRPLGLKSGGTPQPDDVESRFSDRGRADIVANIEGVRDVYLGVGGLGLTDVVAPLNGELDTSIRTQLDAAIAAVEALSDPLRLSVLDDPASVHTVRDVVRDLRRLFEVDVAGLLGINVALSDNDGD